MTTRRWFLAAGLSLPVMLVSCGGEKASSADPPAIRLGRDTCRRCRMIISDARFAAGIVDANGNALVFDDAGEMIATAQEEGIDGRRLWVHGYPSLEWRDARESWYVVTMNEPTPMGSGVFPFDSEEAARAFIEETGGSSYSWDELFETWTFEPLRGRASLSSGV